LCDGLSGTPDLRDRFILGTSASENPGATGGASSYTLTVAQLPAHNHGITGSPGISDPGHRHEIIASNADGSNAWNTVPDSMSDNWQYRNAYTADATTGITVNAGSLGTSNTGTGSSIDNRPAFYKLAFIMKT
jgi:microcystin-dependent protein